MSVDFYKKQEKLKDPALRASLLSGSFERWRRTQCQAPLYVPGEAASIVPLGAAQIKPHLLGRSKTPGYDYVQRAVSAQLTKCDEKLAASFSKGTKEQRRVKVFSDDEKSKPLQPYVNAVFAPDTLVSTVSVCSVFDDLSPEEGKALVDRALPSQWSSSPGDFFQGVKRGTFVNGRFTEDDNIKEDGGDFQIQETVKWSWAPRIEATGGMINVLTIKNQTGNRSLKDPTFAGSFVDKCRDLVSLQGEVAQEPSRRQQIVNPANSYSLDYAYGLVSCVQSKFLSAWTPGGLDLDDGRYMSIWVPSGGSSKNGTLCTLIEKRVHFSSAADVLPQFSRLANLLAPAVITMLLQQLAYDSTLVWLQGHRNPKARQP